MELYAGEGRIYPYIRIRLKSEKRRRTDKLDYVPAFKMVQVAPSHLEDSTSISNSQASGFKRP